MRSLSALLLLAGAVSLWSADDGSSAAPTPVLPTVTVTLRTGEVLIGGLVERTAERVVLRLTSTRNGRGMSADRSFNVSEVAEVSDLHDQYRKRAAAAGTSGQERADLAQWCLANHLEAEAKTEALAALRAESVNADAARLLHRLGQARIDGTWVELDPWLASQGLVRFDGVVCDAATRDKLRTLSATRMTDAKALADATATQAHHQTKLAAAKEQLPKLQEQKANLQKSIQDAAKANGTVEAAKRAVESAAQRVKTAQEARAKKADAQSGKALTDAQEAHSKAQKDLRTAQQAGNGADPATLKKRSEALDKELAAAQADLKKCTDAQAATAAAVTQAQAKADASAAAYLDARKAVALPAKLPREVVAAVADQLPSAP